MSNNTVAFHYYTREHYIESNYKALHAEMNSLLHNQHQNGNYITTTNIFISWTINSTPGAATLSDSIETAPQVKVANPASTRCAQQELGIWSGCPKHPPILSALQRPPLIPLPSSRCKSQAASLILWALVCLKGRLLWIVVEHDSQRKIFTHTDCRCTRECVVMLRTGSDSVGRPGLHPL